MAETAKKGKKKKGKTLALTEFLANDGESGPSVSHAAVFSARSTSWADESEGLNTEVDTTWPEESYGGVSTEKKLRAAMDRASLPTAPRASRGPDIDSSKIPDGPPFTAFLGNLSYDVDKDDIFEFFRNTKITEVRLPQDSNGRLKGFGYAEFEDKKALLDALTLNNEHLKSRRIRVDVAGQQQQERGDRDSRSSEPDRTDSDWRSKPAESSRDHNGYNDRDRYMNDDGPQDRWGQRAYDDGPSRDRPGYRSFDDGPRDRSGYRGFDDGPPRDRSGYRGFDDGPPRDRYGTHRGFEDGPRSRDHPQFDNTRYGDAPRDRRGADYYGDRDRGGGFGSRWVHGDRDRPDDRNYYRSDDRGNYGRDRYDGRRYGDRYGADRYDSRGGYGRDRYEDRRYGDRDRYDDRRYGDTDRRRENDDGPSWRNMSRERDSRSDFDRDEREPVRERPKLQLKPRTKSAEENEDAPTGSSSVFGNARPVNTAAKEREIEEKLARQRLEEESKIKQDKENFKERRERDDFPRGSGGRSRHDSNRSSDGERGPRDRRDSLEDRGRRDSARSSDESSNTIDTGSTSQEPRKEIRELSKELPGDVPPPPENVWAKRMEQQKAASSGDTDKSDSKGKARSPLTSPPRSPERKGFVKPLATKKDSRESRESSGFTRGGRGRGNRSDRIERNERSGGAESSQDRVGRGVRKERRERKPMEPKKYDETQTPVFHTASKFSALMADEDASEQDTEQNVDEEEQA